jgi:hypothetical protein
MQIRNRVRPYFRLFTYTVLVVAMLSWSTNTYATNPSLDVSITAWNPTKQAQTKMLNITSTGVPYTLSSSHRLWLRVLDKDLKRISPIQTLSGNQTVSIQVVANNSSRNRQGEITIAGGGIVKKITVTQASFEPTLSVNEASWISAFTTSAKAVRVISNTAWTVTSDETWLTVNETGGNGDRSVTLGTIENTSTTPRTATVTFTARSSGILAITKTISVTQMGVAPTLGVSEPAGTLEVSEPSWIIESPASTKSINVTSNTTWTVTSDQPWLTARKLRGTGNDSVTLGATENKSTTTRTATVTFTAGSLSKTVNVTQTRGAVPILEVSEPSWIIESPASTKSINVTSNTTWTVTSDQPWLTTRKLRGTGNDSVTLGATENKSTTDRTATVTFTAGSLSKTVNVTQTRGAVPILEVRETRWIIESPASTKSINVTSNTTWTVTSNQPWLTTRKLEGTGNDSVPLGATENKSTTTRTATVTFTAGSGSRAIIKTISVTQTGAAPIFFVNRTAWTFDSTESTGAISIAANTTWTVTSNQTWLTADILKGTGNDSVTLRATKNTSTTTRTATVTFAAGSLSPTKVTITQYGVPVITNLNPSDKVGYVTPLSFEYSKFLVTVTWSAGEREFYPLYEHKATVKIVPKSGQTWGNISINDFRIEGATSQTVISSNEISVTFKKTGENSKFKIYNFTSHQYEDKSIALCTQTANFNIWIEINHSNENNCNKVKDWTSNVENFTVSMLNTEFGGTLSDVDFSKKFDIVFSPLIGGENTGAYHVKYGDFSNCYEVFCGENLVIYTDTFYKDFIPTTKHYVRSTIAHELHHNVFNASSDTWLREALATAAEHFYYKTEGFEGHPAYLYQFNNANDRFSWKVTNFNHSPLSYAKAYFFSQYLRTQAESKGKFKILKDIMEFEETNSTRDAIEKAIKLYIDPTLTFDTFMANFELALQRKDPTGPYGFNGESFFNGLK